MSIRVSALWPSRPPTFGASTIMIAGVDNVSIPANTTAALATFISVTWPFTCKLTAMSFLPKSGLKADLASLSLRMFDEDGELVTDGRNVSTDSPFAATLQEVGVAPLVFKLTGWTWSPQWRKFTRVVQNGERWKFSITNSSGGALVPRLGFEFETLIGSPRVAA